jgi:hypothetical protein
MTDSTFLRGTGEGRVHQRAVDLGDGTFAAAVSIPAGVDAIEVTGEITEENSAAILAMSEAIFLGLGTPALGTQATGTIANEDTVTPADEGQPGDAITLGDGSITETFEFYTPGMAATGNVLILPRLADGDTVEISDGVESVTFEFVDDLDGYAGANTPVQRVADGEFTDPTPTAVNFRAAVNGSVLDITASSFTDNNSTHLVNDAEGEAGNVPIVRTVAYDPADSAMMVSGMSGGQDDTEAEVEGGNIPVPTADWPLAELASAINASGLDITATMVAEEDPDGPGDTYTLELENNSVGAAGNVPIGVREEVVGAWIVTGMDGGSNTSVNLYNQLLAELENLRHPIGVSSGIQTIAAADTEYEIELPDNTRRVTLYNRSDNDLRLAFETGEVAAGDVYKTIPAGSEWDSGPVLLTGVTLYIASAVAADVVEYEIYS